MTKGHGLLTGAVEGKGSQWPPSRQSRACPFAKPASLDEPRRR